ncbi:MAG: hypothetical protein K2N30_03830 [Clostridia bacterium]|nr:hypothetical protein [Clostridia bacterium]
MECEKCKKSFERPLELYNGEWACPCCHGYLALSKIKLNVTDENEAIFKTSEVCYLRALKTPASEKKEYLKLLGDALELCKESAQSGNPKAMIRLGYLYDTGYFPIDEAEAFKQAYEYYRAVWSGKINDMRGGKSDGEYSHGGIKVKRNAARLYLDLLKNAPEKMRRHERYQYIPEFNALKELGLCEGSAEFEYSAQNSDRAARVLEILQGCFSKDRPPLFGLMTVDGEEFRSLASVRENAKGGRIKLLRIAERVAVYLIDITNGVPRAVKTERDFNIPDGTYVLYFFNSNGKHVLSGGSVNAVKRSLEKGDAVTDFARVNELISIICGGQDSFEYVFCDDDIIVHKSKAESAPHALGDLIKTVQKNVERGEK